MIVIVALYFSLLLSNYYSFSFPKFIPFFDIDIAKLVLTSIIGASAAILGITVTILIISIQLLRNKFDDYAITAIFSNKKLKISITLFVATIVFSIITLIQLPEKSLTFLNYNQIYFVIYLFIFVLVYLFVVLISIIKTTSSNEVIKSLLDKIELESFPSLSNYVVWDNQNERKLFNGIIGLMVYSCFSYLT